jgi:pilus assembly protein CpaC
MGRAGDREVDSGVTMRIGVWTRRPPPASTNERLPRQAAACARWLVALSLLPSTLPAAPLPDSAADNVVAGRATIDLSVSEGRILHFDGPVDSVFIADPVIADVRVVAADIVYVYGKKSGITNLIAMSAEQHVRTQIQFRVTANPTPANDAVHKLQPASTVEISILGERAAVKGKTRRIEDAVDAQNAGETYSPPGQPPINNTTIEGSQQINIRVRFAEVSRNELQALGFDWKVFAGAGAGAGTLGIGGGGRVNIDVLMEALRRNGVLNILAEPNLTAVSGQTANFLAGGEVPVPIAQPGGTMMVEYKPYGVSLDFTPTIIATNRIALHVRPQVSTIAHTGEVRINGIDLPAFTVRRADTTVEVASGQTFAIAGLFQRQMTQDLDKLPLLGEVPILGAIFTSERFRRNETELVILITPYLVKPTSGRNVATPLDRPAPPPTQSQASVLGGKAPRSSGLIMK